jgi:FkbM family methyltransferase
MNLGNHVRQPADPTGVAALLRAFSRIPPFCRGRLRHLLTGVIVKLAGGPLKASFRGAIFAINGKGHPTESALLLYSSYDKEEFDFLLDGLPVGGTAVDLGSNIGLYSLPFAARVGPSGTVLAIDASAAFAAQLGANAKLSGFTNVNQEVVAVGDEPGHVTLNAVPGNPGTAMITRDAGQVSIPMLPLLDLVRKHGISAIHVMKVDIDGSEEIALVPFLRDAEPSLHPARLVLEHKLIDGQTSALPASLAKANYRVAKMTRVNSLYVKQAL